MTRDEAWSLANHWVAAWNAHDLDLIMTHYEDASRADFARGRPSFGDPDGRVSGRQT